MSLRVALLALAGTVLGFVVAWLVLVFAVPETTTDAALGVILLAGAAGAVVGGLAGRRGRSASR